MSDIKRNSIGKVTKYIAVTGLVLIWFGLDAYADLTSGSEVKFKYDFWSSINSMQDGWKGLANTVIGASLILSGISVVKALVGGDNGRKMVIRWVVAFVVWQVAMNIW